VSEVGHGLYPIWERVFREEHIPEPALPASQCIPYASGPTPAPPLQRGTYYEVMLSGYTPGNPENKGEGEKRVFISCFHLRQAADATALVPVMVICGNVPHLRHRPHEHTTNGVRGAEQDSVRYDQTVMAPLGDAATRRGQLLTTAQAVPGGLSKHIRRQTVLWRS